MASKYVTLVSVFLVGLHVSSNAAATIEYKMPESCAGKSYCFEKGDNYPDEQITKLLKKMPFLPPSPDHIPRYYNSGTGYDEPDCPSISTDEPIYYVIDGDGKVRVAIQEPELFKQINTVRWCKQEGPIVNDTTHFTLSTLQHHNIECVSTKMNLDFYVLSEDIDRMEIVTLDIPVCCLCRYNR